MTNKLKYFIGNWKMFGDFGSFKIINKINLYTFKTARHNKKKIVLCVPNTLIYYFKEDGIEVLLAFAPIPLYFGIRWILNSFK